MKAPGLPVLTISLSAALAVVRAKVEEEIIALERVLRMRGLQPDSQGYLTALLAARRQMLTLITHYDEDDVPDPGAGQVRNVRGHSRPKAPRKTPAKRAPAGGQLSDRILATLQKSGRPFTAPELAAALGGKDHVPSMRAQLVRMVAQKAGVERNGRGHYQAVRATSQRDTSQRDTSQHDTSQHDTSTSQYAVHRRRGPAKGPSAVRTPAPPSTMDTPQTMPVLVQGIRGAQHKIIPMGGSSSPGRHRCLKCRRMGSRLDFLDWACEEQEAVAS